MVACAANGFLEGDWKNGDAVLFFDRPHPPSTPSSSSRLQSVRKRHVKASFFHNLIFFFVFISKIALGAWAGLSCSILVPRVFYPSREKTLGTSVLSKTGTSMPGHIVLLHRVTSPIILLRKNELSILGRRKVRFPKLLTRLLL